MLFNAICLTLEVSWNGKGRGNVKHSVGVCSWRVDFFSFREIWTIPWSGKWIFIFEIAFYPFICSLRLSISSQAGYKNVHETTIIGAGLLAQEWHYAQGYQGVSSVQPSFLTSHSATLYKYLSYRVQTFSLTIKVA